MNSENKINTNNYCWGYRKSFLISGAILLLSFLIEFILQGKGIILPRFPLNLAILAELLLMIPLMWYFLRNIQLVQWFSSIQGAISSIVVFAILALLMGFIPQNNTNDLLKQFGLRHILHSWPYFVATLQLVFFLGFAIMKRLSPFSFRNFRFALNHIGLWVVITGASLGAGDMKRYKIYAYKDYSTPVAFDSENNKVSIPFEIELIKFKIDEYKPELFLVNKKTGELSRDNSRKQFESVSGAKGVFKNFEIEVYKTLENSVKFGDKYNSINLIGSAPSAYVAVVNRNTGDSVKGWISCGSFKYTADRLDVDSIYSLAMALPAPKKYSSKVVIKSEAGVDTVLLEVNKPFKHDGWELFQTGFDEKMGRWSTYSLIEAVTDPWMSVVYVGFFMMIAGAVLLFWKGKERL